MKAPAVAQGRRRTQRDARRPAARPTDAGGARPLGRARRCPRTPTRFSGTFPTYRVVFVPKNERAWLRRHGCIGNFHGALPTRAVAAHEVGRGQRARPTARHRGACG
jgi:hypothetical protein